MADNESEEMYLETILLLKREKSFVRSVDIVERMDFAKSSVSVAVNKMVKEGLITIDGGAGINFTEKGKRAAEAVYEKHCMITELLKSFGVEPTSAEENACRIEHVISDDAVDKIREYLKK